MIIILQQKQYEDKIIEATITNLTQYTMGTPEGFTSNSKHI